MVECVIVRIRKVGREIDAPLAVRYLIRGDDAVGSRVVKTALTVSSYVVSENYAIRGAEAYAPTVVYDVVL